MTRRSVLLLTLIAAFGMMVQFAPQAVSQDAPAAPAEEEQLADAGFIERMIQNALGGDGRTVRISGLSGMLSSEASIAAIDVADDDGTWLRIRDVVLNWRRLALLRGRLEVDALTVGSVQVDRQPLPAPSAAPALTADPDAEPTPFSLPSLPVSVNVKQLSVGSLNLAEPVIGQALAASINGSASLAGGEGAIKLSMVRIDDKAGSFTLDAGFENESRRLYVTLDVDEDQGGLIASLSGMPDEPPLKLTIAGDAPISDFTAEILLATDNVERLTGTVHLSEAQSADNTTQRIIAADLSGDVANLFLPDYRNFFGRDVALVLRATQDPTLGIDISQLDLTTNGMSLDGQISLSPEFLPRTVDIRAHLGQKKTGLPVTLPLPGPALTVQTADLTIAYDEASGENFTLSLLADGVMREDGLLVDHAEVKSTGLLKRPSPGKIDAITADLMVDVSGFSHTDVALWDAFGDGVNLNSKIDWTNGGALRVTDLTAETGDTSLSGNATVTGLQEGDIKVDATVAAEAGDLGRFSGITGQSLAGQVSADVTASYAVTSGAFDVDLTGKSQDLSVGDDASKALLAGALDLKVQAARTETGINVPTLSVKGEAIDLSGSAAIAADGLPSKLDLAGTIGSDQNAPLALPIPGPETLIQKADVNISYDASKGDDFTALIEAIDFSRAGLSFSTARINADGTLGRTGANGALSGATAAITAMVQNFTHPDPAVTEAVGSAADLSADLDWVNNGALTISDLNARTGDVALTGGATVDGLQSDAIAVEAKLTADAGDLSRFSAISGQTLGGAITADVTASYDVPTGHFDIDLDGNTTDLTIGEPATNNLLAGTVDLNVKAARTEDGTELSQLALKGQAIDIAGTARLAPNNWPEKIDIAGRIGTGGDEPVSLPVPGPEMLLQQGRIDLSYDAATGDKFSAVLAAEGFSRDGLDVGTARVTANGEIVRDDAGTGVASATAVLNTDVTGFRHPDPAVFQAVGDGFKLDADVDWTNGGKLTVTDLAAASGDVTLSGNATVDGLQGDTPMSVAAQIAAAAGDLGRFSAISGQDLGGSVQADLTADYDVATGNFDVDVFGRTRDLSVGTESADDLLAGDVTLAVKAARDATGTALNDLSVTGQSINIAGTAALDPDNWPSKVDITGRVGTPSGAPVVLPMAGPPARLQSADLSIIYDAAQQDGFTAQISARDFERDGVRVGTVDLKADGDIRKIEGQSGVSDVVAKITGVLADASATDPAMNRALRDGAVLGASIDWTAETNNLNVTGLTLTSGAASVQGNGRVAKLGAEDMELSARVDLVTGPLARFSGLTGQRLGGSLTAEATANYEAGTGFFNLDLSALGRDIATGQADLDQLLAGQTQIIVDASQDENGLRIDKADITGTELTLTTTGGLANGQTDINVNGRLRNVGLFAPGFNGPLVLQATATQKNAVWSIQSVLDGPAGSRVTANGDVLRPDGTMNLTANGILPLGLANRSLAPRSIQGDARFDLTVNGPPGLDAVSGTLTVAGARLSDPETRLALENLGVRVNIANTRADLDVSANLSTGGTITVKGPITLTGDIPADIDVRLNKLLLVDPSLYDTSVNGGITVKGALTGGAQIAGRIDIGRTELQIPSTFGGPAAVPVIEHIDEPKPSYLTRLRAGLVQQDDSGSSSGGGGPVYGLDILISAPSQIFIRGRGLDAELGGAINIGGTTAAPVPSGDLQLIRGRMSLLTQNLEFTEATISFQGSLVPYLRMVASSDNGTINANIIIDGPVTDPEITLTSDPELPQDEVLAQLFFSKPVADLSPVELIQLASAINTLSGGGGGLFGKIRDTLGVDQLNVAKDTDGTTSVTAGKYISERVYTDVTVGSDGTSEIQLNYEIRRNFTARGGFDNDGNTSIGLSYETDY